MMDKKAFESFLDEIDVLTKFFEVLDGWNWKRKNGWEQLIHFKNNRMKIQHELLYGIKWDEDGHVVSMELDNNQLNGILPKRITHLKKLSCLKLQNNPKLNGYIPRSLFALPSLKYCYLTDTGLEKTFLCEEAYNCQILQYKPNKVSIQFLLSTKCRWYVDIKESEMFLIDAKLKQLHKPPTIKRVDIKLNAYNATGPERSEAAKKLQRIYRRRRAKRRLNELMQAIIQKKIDVETGQVVYFNSRTGKTSYEKPALYDDKDSHQEKYLEEEERELWQEINDGSENVYYWNIQTGETRWDMPQFRNRLEEELIFRYGKDVDVNERYRLLFLDVDKDGSGQLDKNEFNLLCGDLGLPMSGEQIDLVMAELDSSGDGLIDQNELILWLKRNYK